MKRLLLLPLLLPFVCYSQSVTKQIHIDQFGYLPGALKIAVISDPQIGFNNTINYVPGVILEVRKESDHTTVFSTAPVAWNNGNLHSQSGDIIWWMDFSSVVQPGDYYIYDPANDTRSYGFNITDCVYRDALEPY